MSSENLDEKYKPKRIKDLVGQPNIQMKIEEWVNSPNPNLSIPHMLFAGPPGVGKTSAAMALAQELFGKNWRDNFAQFNASDKRGIEFIRGRIKQLIIMAPMTASFHIIFLDEADEITDQAQDALKEIMQENTETAKFILACNKPEKIISPIQDRCFRVNFKPISDDLIVQRLKFICKNEGITYDESALEILAQRALGSLRQAIILTTASVNRKNHIALENVGDETGTLEEWGAEKIVTSALQGNVKEAERQFLNIYYENSTKYGKIFELILNKVDKMELDISIKEAIINETGLYDYRMCDPNVNVAVQVKCYVNSIARIGAKKQDSGDIEVL